jgi:hypothetical protein
VPKIQRERLPREKWAHLRDRAKERRISEQDLFDLPEWKAHDHDVPDGNWYKDFGTFKLCGTGKFRARFYWPDKPRGASGCDQSSLAYQAMTRWPTRLTPMAATPRKVPKGSG